MTEQIEFTEEQKHTIHQLAALAKESDSTLEIDWSLINITEDETYLMMASNVLQQLEAVPEEHVNLVCMATMTKLLVENFALNLKIKGLTNGEN